MAITTLAGYRSSFKQTVGWIKSAAVASQIAFMPATMFDKAGIPGAGTLSLGTAPYDGDGTVPTAIVPVGTDAGYPLIQPFSGSGYITKVEYMNSVISWLYLYDRVLICGSYNTWNKSYTLPAQPSFAARMPGGADYIGTELWIENLLLSSMTPVITVTYTDQDGNTGHTTGAYTLPAVSSASRCFRIPLADGDTGISVIETVVTSTDGNDQNEAFNLMILRPLWSGSVTLAAGFDSHDMLKTGLVEVFPATALYALIAATSTSTGTPKLMIEIANG